MYTFYDDYVSGVCDGLMDFVDNLHIKVPNLLDEPNEDVTDINSIGHHDGYCHYLNLYKTGENILLFADSVDTIATKYFKDSYNRYQYVTKDRNQDSKTR